MDYETAVERLQALASWAEEHKQKRNEATTRLHLVDQLLIEVLGWPREMVEAERHFRGEYTDYELGEERRLALVEAKREGTTFELPAGFNKSTCRISTLKKLSPGVGSAVDQALAYAQSRGIGLAAVTNGHQIVIFLGSRQDGVSPSEGEALVFDSFAAMEGRFKELWNALSPSGVMAHGILPLLDAEQVEPPPQKLSARLIDYPGFKNRNPVAAELQVLGGLFLEDVARAPEYQEEFVRDTYCESGALSQYAMVSREILTARYSKYFARVARISAQPARTKKGVAPELAQDLLASALSRRPVLLIGDVGVGKSMFIRHLIHVDARDALKRAVVLYVDFVAKPAIAHDLPTYVASEFERQMRDDHGIDIHDASFVRGVYNLALERFASGVQGELKAIDPVAFKKKEIEYLEELQKDREQHLKACLEHVVKGQRRQVVIFLDNVDQRETFFQEQVFVMGHAFAEDWPATVFVALRPDTFWHSRSSGSLSAYQPRVFTIDPPRVDRVITKRLRWALAKLKEMGRLPSFPGNLTLGSSRLESYIDMLAQSFDHGEELIELVDNLSNGNLRQALNFVAMFVGSGHVDTSKIFKSLGDTGRYTIPRHEFLRAIMYGDNEYYDPRDALVLNLYDISERDPREHFLLPCVLSYVDRAGSVGGAEGFLEVGNIFRHFQAHGFGERQIENAVRRALAKDLLHAPRVEQRDSPSRLRIASSGAYTAKRLAGLFAYIDAVVVDTPILSDRARLAIQDERYTPGRVKRAYAFAEYLDECWDDTLLGDFDWPERATALRAELAHVQQRLAALD